MGRPALHRGHRIPDPISAAGGQPVAARPGERSVSTPWTDIAAAKPELAIVAPCGCHLADAAEQAELVAAESPGVSVWAIEADSLVVWPGPRLVDGVEAIAARAAPNSGHRFRLLLVIPALSASATVTFPRIPFAAQVLASASWRVARMVSARESAAPGSSSAEPISWSSPSCQTMRSRSSAHIRMTGS